MMNTVAETNMTQAVKDASLPRPLGMKNKKGSASEPHGAEAQRMGLVCMVGTMLSSLNTNNSTGDLMMQEDLSPEAQRKTKNQGSATSSPISSKSEPKTTTKESLLMNGLTEEKVAAAAASMGKIPDNIFDDVEVVYCKLRGDDTCSTVAGDYSDEDSLSSVDSNGDDECSIFSPPWTPVAKNIEVATEDFTDSEDEKEEEEQQIDDREHVNVAEWHGVAGRLASVFQNALEEDEEEKKVEIHDEPVNVAEWHGVAGRLASVFSNALEEEEEEEEEDEEAVDGVEKIDIRNWENVGARMALVFQEAAEEDWME